MIHKGIPWPSVVNMLRIMGSKVGSIWTKSWGRLLTDSSIVLIARKQPTAAIELESSASSSASAVFIHLQNAAAFVEKGKSYLQYRKILAIQNKDIILGRYKNFKKYKLPNFGIAQVHKVPFLHQTCPQ